jgi:hypothetical protein
MEKRDISNEVFSVCENGKEVYLYGKDLDFWDAEYFRRDKRLKKLRIWSNGLKTAERSYRLNNEQIRKHASVVRYISLKPKKLFERFI